MSNGFSISSNGMRVEALGLTLPWTSILQPLYYGTDDLVLFTGSFAEGLGNRLSDFDLVVIRARPLTLGDIDLSRHDFVENHEPRPFTEADDPNELVGTTYNVLKETGGYLDVEYSSLQEVTKITDACRAAYAEAETVTGYPPERVLDLKKARLAHRIFAGIPLTNPDLHRSIVQALNKPKYCFQSFIVTNGKFPEFKDVLGAANSGDLDRACDLAREYVGRQILGLTHLHLNTNRMRKWLVECVKRLPASCSDLTERFLDIHFRGLRTDAEKRRYLFDVMTFLEEVFAACRTQIDGFASRQNILANTDEFIANNKNDLDAISAVTLRRKMYEAGGKRLVDYLEISGAPVAASAAVRRAGAPAHVPSTTSPI